MSPPNFWKRLRPWTTDEELEAEIDDEFRTHLELRVAENLARGMAPEEARAEAARRLGDQPRWKEETQRVERSIRRRVRLRDRVDALWRQVAQAARSLRRRPSFAIPSILTLALGIGAATAGFAVLDAVILRPLPYPGAERLVFLDSPVPGQGAGIAWGLSVAGYFEFKEEATAVEELGAYAVGSISLTGGDVGALRVRSASVDADLLDVLSARPALGRLIEDEDDDLISSDRPRAVVLGYEFWQRAYGSDPDIVGRTVDIEGEPSQIVGVMEPGFDLPDEGIEVWIPLFLDPDAPALNSHWIAAVGRLAEGRTIADAQAELTRTTQRFPELFPEAYSRDFMDEYGFRTRIRTLSAQVIGPDVERSLWIVAAAIALVLIIATANVANLLLVRTDGRRRESALRAAIGASRSRIVWHALSEGLLLNLAGAAVGILLAEGALRLLLSVAPPGLPRMAEIGIHPVTIAFALALALLLGVFFGVLPILGRPVRYSALRDGAAGVTANRSRHRLRKTMVAAQVALALVLLAGAGLMLRTVHNLRTVDPGFDPGRAVAFGVNLPFTGYNRSSEAVAAFVREVTSRLEALPGVRSAGTGDALPFGGMSCAPVEGEGQPPDPGGSPPCIEKQQVSPGFFAALGVDLRGRAPTWAALDAGAGEAVVTETLARRLWPGQDPIGKGVRRSSESAWYRVVAVTEPIRTRGLDTPPSEAVFYPLLGIEGGALWGASRQPTVIVRTDDEPALQSLIPAIERVVRDVDPTVPIGNVETLDHYVAASPSVVRRSFMMALMTVVGGLALFLSVVGIYGVVSYVVGQRTGEMGLRMALGARVAQVAGMVLRDTAIMSGLGIAFGVAGALLFSHLMESLLFGVSPTDPLTLAGAALLLLALSLTASWVPARRATRIDPTAALRSE